MRHLLAAAVVVMAAVACAAALALTLARIVLSVDERQPVAVTSVEVKRSLLEWRVRIAATALEDCALDMVLVDEHEYSFIDQALGDIL